MAGSKVDAYTDINEFLGKVSWEGGVTGAIEYGLRADEDLTAEVKESNPEFVKLWDTAAEALTKLQSFIDANFEMEEMEEME